MNYIMAFVSGLSHATSSWRQILGWEMVKKKVVRLCYFRGYPILGPDTSAILSWYGSACFCGAVSNCELD